MEKDLTYFKEQLAKWNVELSAKQEEQFVQFYTLLVEKNKVMNLTAITDFDEVIEKHFLDSIALCRYEDLTSDKTVVDLGTGAGFPGVPLKIAFPNLRVTLVDALQKRVGFLNEVICELGLTEVEAVHSRAEEFGQNPDYRESFDLCVSRAVSQLPILSEWCMPTVKVGGKFIAYKSGEIEEEAKTGKKAVETLGGEISAIEKFALPNAEAQRSFVVISKTISTPSKYPRRPGIPEKKPIL